MVNETILPPIAESLVKNLTSAIAALGGIIFLYLVYQSIIVYINRKKEKQIKKINEKLEKIEKLLQELIKKK